MQRKPLVANPSLATIPEEQDETNVRTVSDTPKPHQYPPNFISCPKDRIRFSQRGMTYNPLLYRQFTPVSRPHDRQPARAEDAKRLDWNIRNYEPSEKVQRMQEQVRKMAPKTVSQSNLNIVPLLEAAADEICAKTDSNEWYPKKNTR